MAELVIEAMGPFLPSVTIYRDLVMVQQKVVAKSLGPGISPTAYPKYGWTPAEEGCLFREGVHQGPSHSL